MSQTANLWLYFVVVFGVVALPGLDMAFVMGSSLLGGRRARPAAGSPPIPAPPSPPPARWACCCC